MEPNPYEAPLQASKPSLPARRRVQWWKIWLVIAIGSYILAVVVEWILGLFGIQLPPLPS